MCYISFFSVFIFLFYASGDHLDLHSFPTRRSSDLISRMLVFLLATGISLLSMCIVHGYFSIYKLKQNWNEYRCNPIYMPFAGYIRPDVSTEENFTYCSNSMAGHYFSFLIDGISQYFGVLEDSLGSLAEAVAEFRNVIGNIRGFMLKFASATFSKAASSTSVFVHYLIKIQDVLKRFVGEGYVGALLVNTIIDFIWSFVSLCIGVIKTFVFALLAISIVLALFQSELLVVAIFIASLIASSGF